MATKKQKHEAAVARREQYLEEVRRTGLEAQRKDRAHREKVLRESQMSKHEKHNWKKRDTECLWCKDEIRAARRAASEAS